MNPPGSASCGPGLEAGDIIPSWVLLVQPSVGWDYRQVALHPGDLPGSAFCVLDLQTGDTTLNRILLTQPPMCWNYRKVITHPTGSSCLSLLWIGITGRRHHTELTETSFYLIFIFLFYLWVLFVIFFTLSFLLCMGWHLNNSQIMSSFWLWNYIFH